VFELVVAQPGNGSSRGRSFFVFAREHRRELPIDQTRSNVDAAPTPTGTGTSHRIARLVREWKENDEAS
jgi:hypothetical protein